MLLICLLCCSIVVPKTHIDDEYAHAMERDPKILLTTSRNPSAPLIQFIKVGFVFKETIGSLIDLRCTLDGHFDNVVAADLYLLIAVSMVLLTGTDNCIP